VGPRAGMDGCGKTRSHRDSITEIVGWKREKLYFRFKSSGPLYRVV